MTATSEILDRPSVRSVQQLNEQPEWTVFQPLQSSKWRKVKILVGSLVLLNLFDAGLTWLWIDLKIAEEANWLLRGLVEFHQVAFVTVKMMIVCLALTFIWKHRNNRLATPGLVVACSVYSLLFVYHLQIALWSLHLWYPMIFPGFAAE